MHLGDSETNPRHDNNGYGSKVLKSLIKVYLQLEVESIAGKLSRIDSENFDKLEHFYKKNGFAVDMDNPKVVHRL